ncbi:NACHT domain-containing protein [Actinosynnema sp. NPDC049800]
MADELLRARAEYARRVRELVRALPDTQVAFAKAVHTSPSNLAHVLKGERFPSDELAADIAARFPHDAAELHRLHALGRGAEAGDVPAVVVDLLRAIRAVGEELPYFLPTHQRLSLSGVYVQQNVNSPKETRWAREELAEELGWLEAIRPVSTLAQPFVDVFDQYEHLVVEGGAGLGKSTLLRQLAVDRIDALSAAAPLEGGRLIPLLLPARVLATHVHLDWPEALSAALRDEYRGFSDRELPSSLFVQGIRGHRWLVLVDALDEVPDPADRDALIKAVSRRMGVDGPLRFVITTRPLEARETARLAGAGFFELQAFDRAALERFAHRWFDPDGTRTGAVVAETFLARVAAAGLTDVLEVPLFAAIAAHMHQSDPDSPLPTSRFALYEGYFRTFAEARQEQYAAALSALGDDVDLVQRIGDHFTSLLERLATSYTTSDELLVEVAKRYLTEHDLLPARRPVAWDDLLGTWLCQSGVLVRSGRRLRFLHQTFAEHLAANARATELPVTFVAEAEVWDALIRGLVLDVEADKRVVLHYLHLGGDGDALLKCLQERSSDHRDRAGELIAEGISCADERLVAYLDHLEAQVLGQRYYVVSERVRGLVGLVVRPPVRAWLLRLMGSEQVNSEVKTVLVDVLRESSSGVVREGVDHLVDQITAGESPDRRLRAAVVLARFDGQAREIALETLRSLADLAVDVDTRVDAALALAKTGGAGREQAADVLVSVIGDVTSTSYGRTSAAEHLVKLGGQHHERAVTLLRELVYDTGQALEFRMRAARVLAGASRFDRAAATHLLVRFAENPLVDDAERIRSIRRVAELDSSRRDWAARALTAAARDPLHSGRDRRQAASDLAALGRNHRQEAADALTEVAADPLQRGHDRIDAIQKLVKLGRAYRSRALAALVTVAEDRTVDDHARVWAIVELAGFGAEAFPAVVETARTCLTEWSNGGYGWMQVARLLANLGAGLRQEVLRLCDLHLGDFAAPPLLRLRAGLLAGDIDVSRTALASAFLITVTQSVRLRAEDSALMADARRALGGRTQHDRLAVSACTDPRGDQHDRVQAALALLALPAHRELGVAALRHLLTDPGWGVAHRWSALDDVDGLRSKWLDTSAIMARCFAAPELDSVDEFDWYFVSSGFDLSALSQTQVRGALETLRWWLAGPLHRREWQTVLLKTAASAGPTEEERATGVLRALAADGTVPAEQRLKVIITLLAKGVAAQEWCQDLVRDTDTVLLHRVRAVRLLMTETAISEDDAIDLLVKLADETPPDTEAEITGASALVLAGGEHRRRALSTLVRIAADPAVHPHYRYAAAERLTEIGRERREGIANALHALVSDSSGEPKILLEACALLARFGGDHLHHAVEVASGLALDSSTPPDRRMAAVDALAAWGVAALNPRVEALRSVATDSSADPFFRNQAANHLERLGLEPRRHAIAAWRKVAEDQRVDGWNRLWAATALDRQDAEFRPTAAAVFAELAAAGGVPALRARVELTRLDPPQAWAAAADFEEIASDTASSGHLGLEAVEALLDVNPFDLRSARRAVRRIAEDRALTVWERRLAAMRLATFDLEGRTVAVEVLLAVVNDHDVPVWERAEAGLRVVRFEPDLHDDVVGQVRGWAEDGSVAPVERLAAVRCLFRMSRLSYPAANSVLEALAADPAVEPEARLRAAGLMVVKGRARAEGIPLLKGMGGADGPGFVRVRAWESLAQFDDRYLHEARAVAVEVAQHPDGDAVAVRAACRFLLAQAGDLRAAAVTALGVEAKRTGLDADLARGLLAAHGYADRAEAGEALRRRARAVDDRARVEVANVLRELDPRHRRDAVGILQDIMTGKGDAVLRLMAADVLDEIADAVEVVNDLRPIEPEMW